jgi:hypothetical protein
MRAYKYACREGVFLLSKEKRSSSEHLADTLSIDALTGDVRAFCQEGEVDQPHNCVNVFEFGRAQRHRLHGEYSIEWHAWQGDEVEVARNLRELVRSVFLL